MSLEEQRAKEILKADAMSMALKSENLDNTLLPKFTVSRGYVYENSTEARCSANVNLKFNTLKDAKDFSKAITKPPYNIRSGSTGTAKSVLKDKDLYYLVFNHENTDCFIRALYQLRRSDAKGSDIYRDSYLYRQEMLLENLNLLVQSCNPTLHLQCDTVGVRIARQTGSDKEVDDTAVAQLLAGNIRSDDMSIKLPRVSQQIIEESRTAYYYTYLEPQYLKELQDRVFARDKHQKQSHVTTDHMIANDSLVHNRERLNIYQALAKVAKVQTNHFLYKDTLNPAMSGMVEQLDEKTKFTEIVVSGPRPYPEAKRAWSVYENKELTQQRLEQNLRIFSDISDMIFQATLDKSEGKKSSIFLNRYSLGSHRYHIYDRVTEAFNIINQDGKGVQLRDEITGKDLHFTTANELSKYCIFKISADLVLSMAKHGNKVNNVFTDFADSSDNELIRFSNVIEIVKSYITNRVGQFADLTDAERTQYHVNIAKFQDANASDLISESAKYKTEHPEEHIVNVLSASAGTTAGISKGQYFAHGRNGANDLRSEEVSTLVTLGGILPVQVEKRRAIVGLSRNPSQANMVLIDQEGPGDSFSDSSMRTGSGRSGAAQDSSAIVGDSFSDSFGLRR